MEDVEMARYTILMDRHEKYYKRWEQIYQMETINVG